MTRALALLSGGLDSTLAIKVMLEQGIEVIALHFTTPFCQCDHHKEGCKSESQAVAEKFNIPIKVINQTEEFLKIVQHPKHGYGSQMNPCIDCRILMLQTAARYLKESGASFIITGEVLGQRPMSQHYRALTLIERESGLKGLILRPLSAHLLEPTIPEKEGLVDRAKLLAFSGRSRKPQMALAELFEIKDYPCPAGGCLLTDPSFAVRLKDLLKHGAELTINEALLLKVGRHFRLDEKTRLIVGRNEPDNKIIDSLARSSDILIDLTACPGPLALLRGDNREQHLRLAVQITARYADQPTPMSIGTQAGASAQAGIKAKRSPKGINSVPITIGDGEVEAIIRTKENIMERLKVVPLAPADISAYLTGRR